MPMLFQKAVDPRMPEESPGEVRGLRCAEPGCEGILELRWSPRFGTWFYGCSRWPSCNGTLPAEVDGAPRGEPRTKELQGWRAKAHKVFDEIWKTGRNRVHRRTAYAWLRRVMVLPPDKAHISRMDVEQCKRVIEMVKEKGPGTEFWASWYRPGKRVKQHGSGR